MKYQIVVKESSGVLVDILCVGTRKGNIPTWVVKSIQQHIALNRTVEITQEKRA